MVGSEYLIVEILAHLLDDSELHGLVLEWERTERGSLPSHTETLIILWQVVMNRGCYWHSDFTSFFTLIYLK